MKLNEYFEDAKGVGILATADADGKVDVAVYSRPHFLGDDDQELAFIMNPRLSHQNLQSNPHAAYMFIESGPGYTGKRLFLTKVREENDPERILAVRRRDLPEQCDATDVSEKFLVHFRVDGTLPLIGTEQEAQA